MGFMYLFPFIIYNKLFALKVDKLHLGGILHNIVHPLFIFSVEIVFGHQKTAASSDLLETKSYMNSHNYKS